MGGFISSFEACCQWALHNVQIVTLLFTFTIEKYIYPSAIIGIRNLKFCKCGRMDLNLREEGAEQKQSTQRKPSTNSPKIGITYQR